MAKYLVKNTKEQRVPKVGERVRVAIYTARYPKLPDVHSGRLQRSRSASFETIVAIYADTERTKNGGILYNVLLSSGDAVLIQLGQKGWNAVR